MKIKILKELIKYVLMFAFFILFLGVGQFGQLMHSSVDVRRHALDSWAGADQGRKFQVVDFTQTCIVGKKVKIEDFKKAMEIQQKDGLPEPAIKICAERNGYIELYGVVNKADSILETVAWPLSLLTKL